MESPGILHIRVGRWSRALARIALLVVLVAPLAAVSVALTQAPASADRKCTWVDSPPPGRWRCTGSDEDPGNPGDPGDPGDGGGNERQPIDVYQTPACMVNSAPPETDPNVMCNGATMGCRATGDEGLMMRIYYLWEEGGNWELVDTRCVGPDEEEEPQPPTPAQIRTFLEDGFLPEADVQTSPSNGETVIKFPTIFYTHVENPYIRTPNIGGFPVEITAKPTKFIWNTGEGTFTSATAGVPYSPGNPDNPAYVSYTYTKKATGLAASVQVSWDVTYSINGGAPQSLGPGITTELGATAPVNVYEGESRLTG